MLSRGALVLCRVILVLSRPVLVFSRVLSCCTGVALCCAVLSRVVLCCYSCSFLDCTFTNWLHCNVVFNISVVNNDIMRLLQIMKSIEQGQYIYIVNDISDISIWYTARPLYGPRMLGTQLQIRLQEPSKDYKKKFKNFGKNGNIRSTASWKMVYENRILYIQ